MMMIMTITMVTTTIMKIGILSEAVRHAGEVEVCCHECCLNAMVIVAFDVVVCVKYDKDSDGDVNGNRDGDGDGDDDDDKHGC